MDRFVHLLYASSRWLIVAIAVQIVLVAGLLHVEGLFEHVGMDYLTSFTAAEMIVNGDAANLYDTRVQWEYQRPVIDAHGVDWGDRIMHPYIAPPTLGVVSIPLLPLGPAVAYVFWMLLNLAAVAGGIWLLVRRLGLDWQAPLLVIAGAMPVFMVLMLGQVEGLLFLAFIVFALAIRDGHDLRAGLALAVFAIKPPLLLAPLLYLAVTGRRRAFWVTVVATGAQAIASMALVGPRGVREYIELSQRLSGPDGTIVTNVWGMVNIRSIVIRAFPIDDHLLTNLTIVVLTLTALGVTAWFWRSAAREASILPSMALLAVTTVLTSYHALYHTTTLALIAVVLLVAHAAQQRENARVERVVVFSWLAFTLLPLLAFVIVQTSKLPAMFGVVGVLLLWTLATGTVAQQIAATEAATRPARAEMPPWYVVWERRRVETR
jgi:hypothetical protein